MELSNPLFDDDIQSNSVVDPPNNEESTDVGELVNDPAQTETIFSSIRELLECPVCLNHMYPPIYQCSNGHTICPRCKPRVHNRCPTCRNKLGNIRCLALEKVAASFALPCEYMSLCIQAELQDEVQAEVQAEISENWPIEADAGSFDQAPSWKQVLENRIVHRIVQHMENMIVSVMAKVTDKMEKMALAKAEDDLVNMKDDVEKMIQAAVEDHLLAKLSLAPPHHS